MSSPSSLSFKLCGGRSGGMRRDGARPEEKRLGLPKRNDSGLVERSKTTLKAPLSPYIAAAAKVAAEDKGAAWCARPCMKPIQRSMLTGRIET